MKSRTARLYASVSTGFSQNPEWPTSGEARAQCLKLLQRVDAVVANTLADDTTLTAEWKLRRRIVQRVERILEEPPPA